MSTDVPTDLLSSLMNSVQFRKIFKCFVYREHNFIVFNHFIYQVYLLIHGPLKEVDTICNPNRGVSYLKNCIAF